MSTKVARSSASSSGLGILFRMFIGTCLIAGCGTGTVEQDMVDGQTPVLPDNLPGRDAAPTEKKKAPVDGGADLNPIPPSMDAATDLSPASPAPTSDMVQVAKGPFWMGCDANVDPVCGSDEIPYHQVTLPDFTIDRFEVTQSSYSKCVLAGSCALPYGNYDPMANANLPVRDVTWDMANIYCQWQGKRLPTEAEWEKAARGPSAGMYPWGNSPASCDKANYGVCRRGLMAVGSKPAGASPYGVQDLAGNASEWVADWYGTKYYLTSPAISPTGPATGFTRVIRGGGYSDTDWSLRSTARSAGTPSVAYDAASFRCVR